MSKKLLHLREIRELQFFRLQISLRRKKCETKLVGKIFVLYFLSPIFVCDTPPGPYFSFALPTWPLQSQTSSAKRFLAWFSRAQLGFQVRQRVLNVYANLRLASRECFKVFPPCGRWPSKADGAAHSRRKQLLLSPRGDTGSEHIVTCFTIGA